MSSNVPLLALETVMSIGEIMFLSLVTFKVNKSMDEMKGTLVDIDGKISFT